jgi:VanZ family protein
VAARSRHRSSATPLAGVYAALVVYASLFPFTGWRWPPGQALPALLALPWPPYLLPYDLWFNLLGYLPLGALIGIAVWRSGGLGWQALLAAVLGPAALSFACEVLQQFLPGRHPSLKDLAMNSGGAVAGALLAAGGLAVGGGARRIAILPVATPEPGALARAELAFGETFFSSHNLDCPHRIPIA